jgi:glycerol transport system ATP-binding protein
VLQEGPVSEVYEQPASQRVGEIFSEPQLNLLALEVSSDRTGRLESDESQLLPPPLRDLAPGRYLLGVRPHKLRLRAEGEGLRFKATALVDEVTGASTLLHVAAWDRNLTVQRPGIQREALGANLELFVAARDLFVFDAQGHTLRSAASVAV